jgi:hypothetical protein
VRRFIPRSNPTMVSYNASVVKIYNTMISILPIVL